MPFYNSCSCSTKSTEIKPCKCKVEKCKPKVEKCKPKVEKCKVEKCKKKKCSDIIIINTDCCDERSNCCDPCPSRRHSSRCCGPIPCGLAGVVTALNAVLLASTPTNVTNFVNVSNAYIACRTPCGGAGSLDVILLNAVLATIPSGIGLSFYTAAATFLGYVASVLLLKDCPKFKNKNGSM